MNICIICESDISQNYTGEPYLIFKGKPVCFDCYIDIIEPIYGMAGAGDGGMVHVLFYEMLSSSHNRKKRRTISGYNKILKKLLVKYKFKCVDCGATDKLTIDHIKPVSKGGTDNFSNLQILCKSCNSSKGAKYVE